MKVKSLLKLLEQIKIYSNWDDTDSKLELVLYLDEIRGLAIDGIEMLNEREPIRLGTLIDDPEDVREFEGSLKNPKVTKEQVKFIKEAIELYNKRGRCQ